MPPTIANPILLSDLWIQTKGHDDIVDGNGVMAFPAKPPQLIRFEPNGVQIQYLDELSPRWREGIIDATGLREIVLKARQFGFSTLIAALFFLRTVNNTDINSVVIADAADNSESLFSKMRLFWEMLPADRRPRTRYNTRRELDFPDLRSKISVLTAGKGTAGRSRTIHNLHCSEVPFWPDPAILTGLLQAVPKMGNVFLESTANGEDAVFCTEYRKAKEGPTGYAARFFAWWEHQEYEAEPPSGFIRDDDDTTVANKHELDERFGVARANRKLYWRRQKKSEPGMGTLFAQEYPGDDKEAFLVSGTRFFTEWDEDRHTYLPGEETYQRYWQFFGGYDWGIGAPACFLLAVADERGRVRIIDEVYGANRTDPEQAADVKACLLRWNLEPHKIPIYADSAMWAQKRDQTTGNRIANVKAFHDAGLLFISAPKGPNSRVHGWANVKRYMHDVDVVSGEGDEKRVVPYLRVSRACPNLIRTQSVMIRDKKNPEDADSEVEDHAWDACNYLLGSKPRGSTDPDAPRPIQPKPDPRDPAARAKRDRAGKL